MADDKVTAALDDIRMQAEDHGLVPAADVFRLLGALDAALALPAQWQRFAAAGDAEDECATELREAISRALLGGEAHTASQQSTGSEEQR